MRINYSEILKKNMINVFKDVLTEVENNGLHEGHHLYITYNTANSKVKIPDWLKEKHPKEMTIVIQYEYWDFKVKKNSFNTRLSFNDIKVDLEIPFASVISFSDPYAQFGFRLMKEEEKLEKTIPKTRIRSKKVNAKDKNKNNVIEFMKFKKIKTNI